MGKEREESHGPLHLSHVTLSSFANLQLLAIGSLPYGIAYFDS